MFRLYRGTANAASAKNVRRLARIVGDHRLTRARLSGGFAFAPCRTDTSGERLVRDLSCENPPPTAWASAGDLERYAESMRSSESPRGKPDAHATGVWQLVMGHPENAVADLREAAEASQPM